MRTEIKMNLVLMMTLGEAPFLLKQTLGTKGTEQALPALIERKVLFGNPVRSQGLISPDGSMVSWLAPSNDGVLNVWVAPLADDGKFDNSSARILTDSKARPPSENFWTADSSYILYTLDEDGNENTHVYATDVKTGEVRDLTPVGVGVRAEVKAYSFRQPGTMIVGLNDRDPFVFDLHKVEIATGDMELLVENDKGYFEYLIDNNNQVRGAMALMPDGSATVHKFSGSGDAEEFQTIPTEDSLASSILSFGSNDETLYILDSRGRDKAVLVAVNFTSGVEILVAASDKADVSRVVFDSTTKEPLAYLVDYLKPEWTALEEDFGAVISAAEVKFGPVVSVSIVSQNVGRSIFVVAVESPALPLVYFLYNRAKNEFVEFFSTRPDLDRSLLQPMQAFEVVSRDGFMLTSYLTLPGGSDADGDGTPEEPLPMALIVHGGPWARDVYGYNPWHQWLANRGYAVMSVNYRGSTGFGKAFIDAAAREFAGKMHDDLIDAVRHEIEGGVADPDKVAITGASYGGYATLVGLTFTPDIFACGVDVVGMSNLVTLVENAPTYWSPIVPIFHKFIGNPANETERADMLARSPITRVDDIVAPLLIAQGQNDPRVTKLESDQMVEAMSERNQIVTYVNYPDEGHGFARPENILSFFAVAEQFLAPCLGGRAQDYDDDFEGSSIEVLHGAEYVPGLVEMVDEAIIKSDIETETSTKTPGSSPDASDPASNTAKAGSGHKRIVNYAAGIIACAIFSGLSFLLNS